MEGEGKFFRLGGAGRCGNWHVKFLVSVNFYDRWESKVFTKASF